MCFPKKVSLGHTCKPEGAYTYEYVELFQPGTYAAHEIPEAFVRAVALPLFGYGFPDFCFQTFEMDKAHKNAALLY